MLENPAAPAKAPLKRHSMLTSQLISGAKRKRLGLDLLRPEHMKCAPLAFACWRAPAPACSYAGLGSKCLRPLKCCPCNSSCSRPGCSGAHASLSTKGLTWGSFD